MEIMALYVENYARHTNGLCRKNARSFMSKIGTCPSNFAVKCWQALCYSFVCEAALYRHSIEIAG
jgi:hypothetical protein